MQFLESNYHITKFFTEHLLAIEMKKKNKKTKTKQNKTKNRYL